MIGFEPKYYYNSYDYNSFDYNSYNSNDKELNFKIINENTEHVFWDPSREWKVERAILVKEYVNPHGAFSKFKIDSSIITFSLELERGTSYWEVLYLLPLLITSALSACGLFIPSYDLIITG